MIVGAAVCPGAPLLIPGLAEALAASVPALPVACGTALQVLSGADRLVVITHRTVPMDGAGLRTRIRTDDGVLVVHPPGTPVTGDLLTNGRRSQRFATRLAGPAPSTPDTAEAPGVGVLVAAALLEEAGLSMPTCAIECGDRSTPSIASVIGPATDRIGLLVIADGSASHGEGSPGGGHRWAAAHDRGIAEALVAGRPDLLDRAARAGDEIEEHNGTSLDATGDPALAALAAITMAAPPSASTLLFDDAPFGVGYFVAAWSWD